MTSARHLQRVSHAHDTTKPGSALHAMAPPSLTAAKAGTVFQGLHEGQGWAGALAPEASAEERWGQLGRLVCHLPPRHPTSLWGLRRQK